MGLDMYLFKGKKAPKFTTKDYDTVSDALANYSSKEEFNKEFTSLREALPDLKGVEELDDAIVECGHFTRWLDIMQEVGYWRKANQIHGWFVRNCQGGVDECQLTRVREDKLRELLAECWKVLEKKEDILRGEYSPTLRTQSGFFFGDTSYNEYYFEDIERTIKILEDVLGSTDFEKEVVFYRSSW